MGYKFLSEEWFNEVENLVEEYGDLELPAALQELVVNVVVSDGGTTHEVCFKDGRFQRGLDASAGTKLSLEAELARKIFIEDDRDAGMQAFMAGQIQVEGDPSKLMALQTVQLNEKQRELAEDIADMTE